MSVESDPQTLIQSFEPVLKTEISFTDYESRDVETGPCAELKTSGSSFTKSSKQKNSSPVNEQLCAAAEKGDVAEVKAIIEKSGIERLLEVGCTRNNCFRSPMIAACSNGQRAVVEELLRVSFPNRFQVPSGRCKLIVHQGMIHFMKNLAVAKHVVLI